MVALAKSAAAHGGVYTATCATRASREIEAITEAANVGKEAGIPVQISHLKIDRRRVWGASEQSLALIEKYRREGVDVTADQYPYDRAATNLGIRLPSLGAGRREDQGAAGRPRDAAKIAGEMKANLVDMGEPDYAFATVARFASERRTKARRFPRSPR